MNRTVLLSLLILALLLVSASCGGGAGTAQLDGVKDAQGISEGGFNLVRYDDQGTATNALNPTLDLNVQPAADTTTVTIAIDDKQPALGVTLDLHYDPSKFTPQDVEFGKLIDTDVELAVTRIGGLVALGQVSTSGAGMRNGQFATVTFRNEANRTISAAGDAADKAINTQYSANSFVADGIVVTGNAGAVDYNILGIFTSLSGDGDQNGVSNIADLTPLGALLGKAVSTTDAVSARADYDGNGLPNISDLTPLGANLGETTTGIEILAGDADPPTTVVATLDWNVDGDPPVGPTTVTADPADVWRQFGGSIDATTAQGIDTAGNGDDHIFISARAITSGAGVDGTAFTPAIDVTLGGTPPTDFIVESVTIEINGTPVTDGMTLDTIKANDDVTFEVTGFDGKFAGADFDPGALTTDPTPAEYAAELALVQADFAANITQILDPVSFPGFASDKTNLFLDLDTSGSPVTATAFSDDDPGNTEEGSITFGFTRANSSPVADVTVGIDLQADGDAPLLDDIRGSAGQDGNNNWPITAVAPDIHGHLTFPGGDPSPLDGTTVDVELVDLTNHVVLNNDFTYVAGLPSIGNTFSLNPAVTGYDFTIRVPAGALSENNLYMVRFFTPLDQHGSSVNNPDTGFLTGGPVPVGVNSTVIPMEAIFDGTDNKIAILMEDPFIRRNPQDTIDVIGGNPPPADFGGFNDVLKSSGDEFPVAVAEGAAYPQIVIQLGNDPSVIQANAVSDGTAIQEETGWSRIVVDIAGYVADPLNPTYAYKVFSAPTIPGDLSSRPVVTSGTFDLLEGPGPNDPPLVGTDFGVNIFDGVGEGDLTLGNEDFSNKTLRLTSLPPAFGDPGNDMDVLFVQFNGGNVDPMNNIESTGGDRDGYSGSSNVLTLHDPAGLLQDTTHTIDVRIAGIGTGDLDYIGVAHFVATDAFPGGGLLAGTTYDVQLNNPNNGPASDYTFATGLNVSN